MNREFKYKTLEEDPDVSSKENMEKYIQERMEIYVTEIMALLHAGIDSPKESAPRLMLEGMTLLMVLEDQCESLRKWLSQNFPDSETGYELFKNAFLMNLKKATVGVIKKNHPDVAFNHNSVPSGSN